MPKFAIGPNSPVLIGGGVNSPGYEGWTLRSICVLIHAQRAWKARLAATRTQRRKRAASTLQRMARGRFARTKLTCIICLSDDVPRMHAVHVARACRNTEHKVCPPCARQYLSHELGQGRLFIRCPGGGCRQLAASSDVERLLPSTQLTAYRDKMADEHASRLEDVFGDPDLLSFTRQHCRVCPACGVLIYRYQGCDHVLCRCGLAFNWQDSVAQIARAEDA
jgi:hypothetical protein